MPTLFSDFVARCTEHFSKDPRLAGFSIGGSWNTPRFDEFSDLDFIIAVYAEYFEEILAERTELLPKLGKLLSYHLHGDPRMYVALYEEPPYLLHADLKWVRLEDYADRVENPSIIWERRGELSAILATTPFEFPKPSLQGIEDRIWTWVHYVLSKLGRGEVLEAADYLTEIRLYALAPLVQMLNGREPRRLRKAESLPEADYAALLRTVTPPQSRACLDAVRASIDAYLHWRDRLATPDFQPRTEAQAAILRYLHEIEARL